MTDPFSSQTAPSVKKAVPALVRGLKVLQFVANVEERPNLSTIVAEVSLPLSSAHAICATLVSEGYLERASDGTFGLTHRVLDLASSKIGEYDVVEEFYNQSRKSDILRANGVTLTVRENADAYFVAVRNSPHPVGYTFRTGTRVPACCIASGRAMLADLTNEEVCLLYPSETLPQLTKTQPQHREQLLSILEDARNSGYALESKGLRPSMLSIGVAISVDSGPAKMAVSVTLYEEDMTVTSQAEAAGALKAMADHLSRASKMIG